MPLRIFDGTLLLGPNGKLASDEACCCEPPPPPTGACCTGSACEIKTEAECNALGGTWEGADTTCDPDPCLGACCEYIAFYGDPPGPCTDDVYEDDCSAPGNVWHKGVLCSANEALCTEDPVPVRCCLPDGTCNEISYTAEQCVAAGGTVSDAESCAPNPCCIDDDDCAACECCGEDGCEEAPACTTPTVTDASWCGAIGPAPPECLQSAYAPCSGEVYCEDTETTYTFTTNYFFCVESYSPVESVPCGGTQTTSPASFPAIPARCCRFIYRFGGGFGQGTGGESMPDVCKARFWWGYIDIDPCAPSGSELTMVEDTASAIDNAAIDDCESENTPGCRTDCDTDVDDCFSNPPVVLVNPAP